MNLPNESEIRSVIQLVGLLQHRFGSELGRRPLVLPNGKFFPDKFQRDLASVQKLLERMQEHSGLSDVPIELRLVSPGSGQDGPVAAGTPGAASPAKAAHSCSGDCGGKGCADCDGSCHHGEHDADAPSGKHGHGAKDCATSCGSGCSPALPDNPLGDQPRLVDLGSGWRIQVPTAELGHAVALTTNLARTLGIVFLAETSSEKCPVPQPLEVSAELVGCLLGFGSLLLAGSYVYSKGCGGPQIGRVTKLGPTPLAIATVLFAGHQGHDLRPLLRELGATQKAAVEEMRDFLAERPTVLERFNQAPERLAQGEIPLEVAKAGFWARVWGKPARGASAEGDIAELEAQLAAATRPASPRKNRSPDPRTAELRALVDEALSSTASPPE